MTGGGSRVAVVTGANRGIGRAIAVALAADGFAVAASARDPATLADTVADTLATDLDGVFLTFRAFVPGLITRRSGCLIAISSMTGKRPLHGRTPYAAAKLGVIGLVRTLALELGRYQVRVNAVCPGAVAGPRIDDVIRKQATALGVTEEEARASLIAAAPLRRLVTADEVARTCAFLASEKAEAITGEVVNVSAGAVMY